VVCDWGGAGVSLATAESIRDRIRTVIEYIDPVSDYGVKFRRYRAENGVQFRDAMEAASNACLRRFHVRNVSAEDLPTVSNIDFAEYQLDLEIEVAYPQTNRFGPDGALDREDVIDQDWKEIDYNIGICGRGNFAGTYDCTPIGCTPKDIEEGEGVDFLVFRASYIYKRALSQNGGLAGSIPMGVGG
jgi:hypothetical protein